jgi:GxxExxY protein
MSNDNIERLATQIVDSAIKIHKALGPGLLENIYQLCFVHELQQRRINVAQEVSMPLIYEKFKIEHALRLDLVVEDLIIVELKAVEQLLPVHQAQLLTYLRLSNKKLGFLLNFNVVLMKQGIKRLVL